MMHNLRVDTCVAAMELIIDEFHASQVARVIPTGNRHKGCTTRRWPEEALSEYNWGAVFSMLSI
jgi:hypothetical protein